MRILTATLIALSTLFAGTAYAAQPNPPQTHPVQTFSYIAWREASCRLDAVNARWRNGQIVWTLNKNGSYDSGLFQVNSSWLTATRQVCGVNTGNKRKDLEALYDVDCSIAMAVWIMENTKGKLGNWNL